MSNSICSGASNQTGCMRPIKTDICAGCDCGNDDCKCPAMKQITSDALYSCEKCICITDSIECYELRDKNRATVDIGETEEGNDAL